MLRDSSTAQMPPMQISMEIDNVKMNVSRICIQETGHSGYLRRRNLNVQVLKAGSLGLNSSSATCDLGEGWQVHLSGLTSLIWKTRMNCA